MVHYLSGITRLRRLQINYLESYYSQIWFPKYRKQLLLKKIKIFKEKSQQRVGLMATTLIKNLINWRIK